MNEMLQTIMQLSSLIAPSGGEDAAAEYVEKRAAAMGHVCQRDALGNLFVQIWGQTKPKERIFFTAHLDEPGFMISGITDEGLLRFGLTGKTQRRTLLGTQVLVGEKGVRGVIGLKPIHLTTPEERKTLPKVSELYIDIGAEDKAQALHACDIGDLGVFAASSVVQEDRFLLGKAMSRSISCGILLELMKRPLPVDATFVFTVQRHVGNRGAYGAAGANGKGSCIIVDICSGSSCGDELPLLGKGAVLARMDEKAMFDLHITKQLTAAAHASDVMYQPWGKIETNSDCGIFQQATEGRNAAAIFCPAKMIDSPMQMIDQKDAERIMELLLRFLEDKKL